MSIVPCMDAVIDAYWTDHVEVFKVRWWMKHYSGPTAKRHIGLTNMLAAGKIDKGRLRRAQAKGPATCVKYLDKRGQTKYKGTRLLKSTQYRTELL